jgi:hypothetical protein
MVMGTFSNLFQKKTPDPWIGGLGLLTFNGHNRRPSSPPESHTSWPVNEMPGDHGPAKSIRVLLAEDQGMMHGAHTLILSRLALLLGVTPPTRKRAGFLCRWLSGATEGQPGP